MLLLRLKVQHNEHIFCQKEVTRIDDERLLRRSKKKAKREERRDEDENQNSNSIERVSIYRNSKIAKMVDGFT